MERGGRSRRERSPADRSRSPRERRNGDRRETAERRDGGERRRRGGDEGGERRRRRRSPSRRSEESASPPQRKAPAASDRGSRGRAASPPPRSPERSRSPERGGKKDSKKDSAQDYEPPPDVPLPSANSGVPKGVWGIPLKVSTCIDETISKTIHGTYYAHSMNDGKVVFKKDEKFEGLDVLIYYWDDRENPELSGWWFGPSVGGDLVWAFHPSRLAMTPPVGDWNVPHDGEVDADFTVTVPPEVRRPKK